MRLNDSLAATYTIDGEPDLIIYKVDRDGLTGAWAIRGHRAPSSAELVVNGARGDLRTDCRRDITEIFTPLLNGRLS
jgi:hypothetical protein